jgi:hypothetical protein
LPGTSSSAFYFGSAGWFRTFCAHKKGCRDEAERQPQFNDSITLVLAVLACSAQSQVSLITRKADLYDIREALRTKGLVIRHYGDRWNVS